MFRQMSLDQMFSLINSQESKILFSVLLITYSPEKMVYKNKQVHLVFLSQLQWLSLSQLLLNFHQHYLPLIK